jgi:hypothetical protein
MDPNPNKSNTQIPAEKYSAVAGSTELVQRALRALRAEMERIRAEIVRARIESEAEDVTDEE